MNQAFHHCHEEKVLHPVKMKPIQNYDSKPRGGFWTSPYEEGYGSDWVQWLLDEDYREEEAELTGYLLTPKKDAQLYIVDSYEDCLRLLQDYLYIPPAFEPIVDELRGEHGYQEEQLHRFFGIDHEKMQKTYDGFHLTRNGFIDCHLKVGAYNASLFSGFDCESTVWFNWCFEEIKYIETTAKKKEMWNVDAIARQLRKEKTM